MIVTDHHQPGERLPDCPILHPASRRLPVRRALRDRGRLQARGRRSLGRRGGPSRDLDLVALATVADLVPLRGENRALVRARARGGPPGAAARAAGADARPPASSPSASTRATSPSASAPRINAAGRLYRADAGVELMLTADDERARRRSPPSSTAPTTSAATPSARCSSAAEAARARAARRARRRARRWCSPARAGTRAWSGSSPRGWSSATAGPSS